MLVTVTKSVCDWQLLYCGKATGSNCLINFVNVTAKHHTDLPGLANLLIFASFWFSKLLERIVLNQLNVCLQQFNLLPGLHSAYRRCHSTETAMLKVLSDAFLAADTGQATLLGLLVSNAAVRSRSVTFSWRKQTAGTTVLHGQLWTAFLRFFWSDCLEWYTGSSAQPGLISKWL